MTQNVLQTGPEIWGVVSGAVALFIFALFFAIPHRAKALPGRHGHRDKLDEPGDGMTEEIWPDGYIDSFAGEIEEAGGGMPPLIKVVLPGVLLWWLIYLILNWNG